MADSLATLLQNTTLADDPSDLLKAANERLKHSKKDALAQHTRLVALIKLDRYDDAARAVADGGDPLRQRAPLECAYALYKDGQLERAREGIRGDERDRGTLHLQAQVAYRSEEFALAADLYEALGRRAEDDAEESDLRINSGATDAQLAWAGQGHLARKTGHDRVDQEQFETAFNAACRYIARGELRQAHVQLGLARDLLTATDLLDEEKRSEMLPITVQRVYVLCRLGKLEEAEKLCSETDINSLTDPATRHIGQTNRLSASSKPANPYLSHRFFQATSTIPKNDLPFKFQSSALQRNSLTLDLQAGKYGSVFNSTAPGALSSESQTEDAPFGVFNAAAKARNQTGKTALKEIVPMLEKRPHDLGLLLTVVQLYMLTNNVGTATSLVESFIARLEASSEAGSQDARFAPGLVAILVSLYAKQSRKTQTKTELAKAASYWRHKSKGAGQSSSLLKAAGATLLNSSSTDDRRSANELFRNAYESDPDDPVVIAGLVASQEDGNMANLAKKLPPIAELIAGIDADALEAAGIAQLEAHKVETSKRRKAPDPQAQPTTPKKIKRSRLPKDYDPSKKPDPERWLPLKDRSYYRPKGKKKAKGGGMATQGGVVQEEGRPGTPNQQQQLQQKAGGTSKSKKKKGKGGK